MPRRSTTRSQAPPSGTRWSFAAGPVCVLLQPHLRREGRRVELEVTDAGLLGEALVVTGVAFVGGDDERAAVALVRVEPVRHVHATHRPVADVDPAVLVAGVQPVAQHRVVLVAERQDLADRGAGQIDDGEGVVLLQRHPGGRGRGIDRHVLGLKVLRDGGAGAEDAHPGGSQLVLQAVERGEVGGADVILGQGSRVAGDVDDADRTLGVARVADAVTSRLTLVGDHDLRAVR